MNQNPWWLLCRHCNRMLGYQERTEWNRLSLDMDRENPMTTRVGNERNWWGVLRGHGCQYREDRRSRDLIKRRLARLPREADKYCGRY